MEIFIGRARETTIIKNYLDSVTQTTKPIYLSIVGTGGMGKTQLLKWVRSYASANRFVSTELIDLSVTRNRSKINLITMIAEAFSGGNRDFSKFFDASKEYEIARDIEKSYRFDNLLKIFVECVNTFANKHSIIILFDTFESTQGRGTDFPLQDLLTLFEGKIGIVIAGRNEIDLPINIQYQLELMPFTFDEIESLAKAIYANRQNEFDLDHNTLSLLHSYSQGRPILIVLAVEWILENFHPEELFQSSEPFEQQLVQFLPKLDDEQESKTILIMATADRRFNAVIAKLLLGENNTEDLLTNLLRFSFVKDRLDNGQRAFSLHDEMKRLVHLYVDFDETYKNELRKQLIEGFYYPSLEAQKNQFEQQTLITELIHYLIFVDLNQALKLVNTNLQNAIKEYELDFAYLLLREVALTFAEITDKTPAYVSQLDRDLIEINKAELLLKQYKPKEAKDILDDLYTRQMLFDPEMRCRVLSAIGGAMINPSTTVEADLFEAIPYWLAALKESEANGLESYTGEILFQLASTHVLIGQHNDALVAFERALAIAEKIQDKQLEAKVLNELGKLYRLRMEPQLAQSPIEKSMSIRKQIDDEKSFGISYYYLANLYRDLNDFQNAIKYYELAKIKLTEIGDQNALCELYCDLGWFYVLNENWVLAEHFNNISQEIANKYLLGREISENLHIMYHLEIEKGSPELAYEYVHKAYDVAKRYLNVYMILDCLMHIAQEAYRNKNYDRVPEIIEEMEDLVKRGCGIIVFNGRTINVHGDCLYDQGDFAGALEKWTQGFTIIAVHGNSRTNVELFEDHFSARQEKLKNVLLKAGKEKIIVFKNAWQENVIKQGHLFNQMVELCDELLMSVN
jgi:tetratricopeptide (TPR) repeat protein